MADSIHTHTHTHTVRCTLCTLIRRPSTLPASSREAAKAKDSRMLWPPIGHRRLCCPWRDLWGCSTGASLFGLELTSSDPHMSTDARWVVRCRTCRQLRVFAC